MEGHDAFPHEYANGGSGYIIAWGLLPTLCGHITKVILDLHNAVYDYEDRAVARMLWDAFKVIVSPLQTDQVRGFAKN